MLERTIGEVLKDAKNRYPWPASDSHTNGMAFAAQNQARAVIEELRRELQRDESVLTEIGLTPAALRDEDDEVIEAWVFVL